VVDGAGIAVLVPVSILVAMLLFLNEFPDADVDKMACRRHLVILLGKKRASSVYVASVTATYVSIILAVAVRAAPPTTLISVLTIPIAYRACRTVLKNYDRIHDLISALGANVMVILSTILLIAVGFLVGPFI